LTRYAFGDDERHIVVLFGGAELLNLFHDGSQQVTRSEFTMAAQSFGQSQFSKFVTRRVEGFGDTVRVKGYGITGPELAFPDLNNPIP
jgi:hypothetical protein